MVNTADSLDSLMSDPNAAGVMGVPDTAEGQQALGSALKKKAAQRQAEEEREEAAKRKQAQTRSEPEAKRKARPSGFDEAAWDRNVPKHTGTKDVKRPVHYFQSHGSLKVKRYTIGKKENGQAVNFYSASLGREGVAIAAARAAGHKTVMLYGSQAQKDKMWLYMMRDNLRAVRDASLGAPVFMMQALSKEGGPFVPSEKIKEQFAKEFMGVVTNPKREASENLQIMGDFYAQQGMQVPGKVRADVEAMNGGQRRQAPEQPRPASAQQRATNSPPPMSTPTAYTPSPFMAAAPLAAAAATAGAGSNRSNGHVAAPYANIPTAPVPPPQGEATTSPPAFAQGSSKFVAVQPEEQPQASGRRRSEKPTMPYPTVEEINAQPGRRRPEKPTIPYPVMRANTKDVDVEASYVFAPGEKAEIELTKKKDTSSVHPNVVHRPKVDVIFYDPDLKLNGAAPTPVDRTASPTAPFIPPAQVDKSAKAGEYTGPYKAKGPTSAHIVKRQARDTDVMPAVKPPMPDPRSVAIPPIPPHILSALREDNRTTDVMPAVKPPMPDPRNVAIPPIPPHLLPTAQSPAPTPRTAQIMSIPVLPPDLLAEMNARSQNKSPVATPAQENMEAPPATNPLIYIGPVRYVTMELTPSPPKQPGTLKKMFDAAAALPRKIYRALTSSKPDATQQSTEPAFITSLAEKDASPASVEQTGLPKGMLTELPVAQAGTLVSSGSPTKRTP